MVGKCSLKQLHQFLQGYDKEFLQEFIASIEKYLLYLECDFPLNSDQVIMAIPLMIPESEKIYLINDDGENLESYEQVLQITNYNEIENYVIYNGKGSKFLNISISPWEYSNTLLAIPKWYEIDNI